MEHQRIDAAARVWIVSRGPDGKLRHELDPGRLGNAARHGEIADAVIEAAGKTNVAETRLW